MDVITGAIRLDREGDGVELEPSDWEQNGDAATLWLHRPTHSVWQVWLDPAIDTETTTRVTRFDFIATLNHVCDGHAIPAGADLTALGRAAIVVCLEEIYPGMFRPKDDLPF